MPPGELRDLARNWNEMLLALRATSGEVARRTERLEALHDISTILGQSPGSASVLDEVIQRVLTLVSADAGALFTREGERLTLRAHRGLPPGMAEGIGSFAVGESLPGLVAASGDVVAIDHGAATDPRLTREVERLSAFETFFGLPLASHGKVVGVLAIGTSRARAFAGMDRTLLCAVGDMLGAAIANERLYTSLARSHQRAAGLFAGGKDLLSFLGRGLEEDEVLKGALAALCRLTRARYGAVGIVSPEGALLRFVHFGMGEEDVRRIGALPAGKGLLGVLLGANGVLRLDDLTKDPRHTGFPAAHPPMRSFLGVAVMRHGSVYGRLYLTEKEGGAAFTEEDARLVESFAASLALSIENVKLVQDLRRSEGRYRDLYERAPDGYLILDPEGRIESANETLASWLGYGQSEIGGRMRLSEFAAGREDGARLDQAASSLARGEPVAGLELDLLAKGGVRVPVRLNAVPSIGAGGIFAGARVTLREISRERALAAQLLQAQKLESVGRLAGGIAHDMNNMLTGILGFSELARGELPANSPLASSIEAITRQGRRAADLVRSILSFSRLGVSERKPTNLSAVVRETAKLLERTIPETIDVRVDIVPDLAVVRADSTQIQQVLLNLGVNARDAMPEGGTVTLRAENVAAPGGEGLPPGLRPGRHVALAVADTGIGMSPEVRGHLFEPFFTTKGVGKGTGLGLAVVYGIVSQHGGVIDVESEPGRGTRVRVFLPAVAEEGVAVPAAKAGCVPPRGKGEIVLLVDDDPTVADVGRRILESLDYRVLATLDSDEALRIYRERSREIALILSDVVMPRRGGRELLREFRIVDPAVKVLFVSGYSQGAGVEDLGGVGLVTKPFGRQDLAERVRAAIDDPPPPGRAAPGDSPATPA